MELVTIGHVVCLYVPTVVHTPSDVLNPTCSQCHLPCNSVTQQLVPSTVAVAVSSLYVIRSVSAANETHLDKSPV